MTPVHLEDLRTLYAVADCRSFRRAAQRTNQSPSAVSKQIKRLEHVAGVALFDRSGPEVVLTPAGRAFIDESKPGVEAVGRAIYLAQRLAQGELDRLRVGHSGASATAYLAPALASFAAGETSCHVQVREGPSDDLVGLLLDDVIDLAILRPPVHHEELAEQQLVDEEIVAVVPTGHHLVGRRDVTVADLSMESFVLPPSQGSRHPRDMFVEICQQHGGFEPVVTQEAGSTASILFLVATGAGITFMPRRYRDHYGVAGVKSVRIRGRLPRLPLHLAWRRSDPNPSILSLRTALGETTQVRRTSR